MISSLIYTSYLCYPCFVRHGGRDGEQVNRCCQTPCNRCATRRKTDEPTGVEAWIASIVVPLFAYKHSLIGTPRPLSLFRKFPLRT